MDYEQALLELRLGPNPTSDEIRRAYRARLKAGGHPDVGDATGERFSRLQEALAVVSAHDDEREHSAGTALTRLDPQEVAIRRAASIEAHRAKREEARMRREESRERLGVIAEVYVGRLQRTRRRNAWVAGLAGVVGAVALLLRGIGGTEFAPNNVDSLIVAAAASAFALAALFGLLTAVTALRLQALQDALDDVSSALSRRPTYLAVLREIAPGAGSHVAYRRESTLEWGIALD
jgi:hypothetical protein